MESTDLTVEILKSIRDEVKQTNARLDQTNTRLDSTNARLDSMSTNLSQGIEDLREELSRRIVESEVRTATAITELAGSVREMKKCEAEIGDLRRRLDRVAPET